MRYSRAGKIAKILLFAVAASAALGWLVTMLWNWLIPPVFGWHTITFWQGLGLFLLSKILFGGFRGYPGHRPHWQHRMKERWERMTPEERERFRQGMRGRCNRGAAPAAPEG